MEPIRKTCVRDEGSVSLVSILSHAVFFAVIQCLESGASQTLFLNMARLSFSQHFEHTALPADLVRFVGPALPGSIATLSEQTAFSSQAMSRGLQSPRGAVEASVPAYPER